MKLIIFFLGSYVWTDFGIKIQLKNLFNFQICFRKCPKYDQHCGCMVTPLILCGKVIPKRLIYI